MGRELPIHHFSQGSRRKDTAPHLSNMARSCRTTRHSPFLAPAMPPLTLLFDHPRKAEPTMNGHRHRTRPTTSSHHRVAPLTNAWGATESPLSVATRDTVRGGAGVHGSAPRLEGRPLFSWHGRVALRDTTVPDPTRHGVSGRGASTIWLPKPLAQRRLRCNS